MDTATPERDFLRFRESADPEALARVFDALAPKLLLVAHHLTRDAAAAEDLVQASFLAALRTVRDYDGRRPLLGWMVGILAHRARDERRRARVRAAEPVGAELPARDDPLANSVESETLERITAAIDGLEEPYREVLVLRLVHGLAPTEIAHTLGRAPGTVRMQLARARETLRARLPKELFLPALFLRDDGVGLAPVRAGILRAAEPAAATATMGVGASGLAGKAAMAAALVVGIGALLWWRARTPGDRGELGPTRSSAALAAEIEEPVSPMELPNEAPRPERESVPASASTRREESDPAAQELVQVNGIVTTLAGEPLEGAAVELLGPTSDGVGRELARSDPEGRFSLHAPPGGLVVARKSGFQPSGSRRGSARLPSDSREPVALVLRMGADGHRVSGQARASNGAPAAGARVALCVDEDARKQPEGMPVAREQRGGKPLDREILILVADGEGRFASDEVPLGAATVLARGATGMDVGWSQVEVRADNENRVEIALAPGASVVGRVRTSLAAGTVRLHAEWSGEAMLGALDDNDWGAFFSDRTVPCAADGSFVLAGLLPGRTTVRVLCGAFELASERVELGAGERRALDFDLPAAMATSVRALGPSGTPLAGWGVTWSGGSFELDSVEARTPRVLDDQGRCEIASIELTEHVFALHAPSDDPRARGGVGSLPRALRDGVWPTASEIVLHLSAAEVAGASVSGSWIDESGVPLAEHELRLQAPQNRGESTVTRTDGAGRFRFDGLPSGEFVLTADEEKRLPRARLAEFTLAAGEARELGVLCLPSAARLRVEVVGADGEVPERLVGVLLDPSREILGRLHPDGDGLVSDPLAAGEVLIYLTARGYPDQWRRVLLEPGGTEPCRIELARGVPVEIRVSLPEPVDDCQMSRGGGRVHLTLRTPDEVPAYERRLDAPLEPGRRLRLSIELPPGRYLGTLEDHTCENAPLPRAQIPLTLTVDSDAPPELEVAFP